MHRIKINLPKLYVYDIWAELGMHVDSRLFGRKIIKEDECYKPIYFYPFCFHKLSMWRKLLKTEWWKVDKIYVFLIT